MDSTLFMFHVSLLSPLFHSGHNVFKNQATVVNSDSKELASQFHSDVKSAGLQLRR